MTGINTARETIYSLFKLGWGLESPYWFDNEVVDYLEEEWVRLTVRHTDSFQETIGSIGNRKFRRSGLIIIQVFELNDQSTKRTDQLSDLARSIFEGKYYQGLWFSSGLIKEIGNTSKWYQTNVEIPFSYDEIK